MAARSRIAVVARRLGQAVPALIGVIVVTFLLTRALPEGVLEANGRIDGFLYFEHVQKEEGTPITFNVDFKGAQDEGPFVSLQMPFVLD